MSFIWPPMLLALVLVPLGVWLHRTIGRRRARGLEVYGGPPVATAAAGRAGRVRAVVPAALFLAALIAMALALARPQATLGLPRQEGTVILAMDVSGSMSATDLQPTRMAAARAAAKAFVARQPLSVVIGVVAFSDAGISVQSPTNDQGEVLAAIDRLSPQHGTALGHGILASLNAIAAQQAGPWVDYYTNRSPTPTPTPTPVPPGTHAPAAIVLVSDGENNEEPDPLAAAHAAADRGVRIFSVGIGSAAGTILDLNGFRVHTQLDEATLQQVSSITDGTYYPAADESQLQSVYDHLDTQLVVRPEMTEITSLFAAAGVLFLAGGALTSLLWLGRLP